MSLSIKCVAVCGIAYAGLVLPLSATDAPGSSSFRSNCVICHSADGSGNTALGKKFKVRDLRSPEVQKATDAELSELILKGKKPMPAFAGKLNEKQVQEVVEYLREMGKK